MHSFTTPNFNKRTETFQITIDDTVRHMEDKVKNLGVIFDSRLSFELHIKSLCSRLNGTPRYLNRVKNTLDQKSKIIIIIIYHDFLPTPRRGSHVKSGKTHTQSSR